MMLQKYWVPDKRKGTGCGLSKADSCIFVMRKSWTRLSGNPARLQHLTLAHIKSLLKLQGRNQVMWHGLQRQACSGSRLHVKLIYAVATPGQSTRRRRAAWWAARLRPGSRRPGARPQPCAWPPRAPGRRRPCQVGSDPCATRLESPAADRLLRTHCCYSFECLGFSTGSCCSSAAACLHEVTLAHGVPVDPANLRKSGALPLLSQPQAQARRRQSSSVAGHLYHRRKRNVLASLHDDS